MEQYQRRSNHFEALFANPKLIWMGQNTNHLPSHPDVKRAMIAAIEDEVYHSYAPPAGLAELRRLILDDFEVSDADALITDGAIEGLYHACRHFIRPGDRMITTDPTWTWPGAFAKLSGAEVVALPIYEADQNYKLTADQLAAAVADGGARLIYIVDPLNPLGICYTAEEIEAFAAIARSAEAYLIHDCTYRHFAYGHTLAYRYYPERTITTYSLSKWLGAAGLRIGALMARPSLLQTLSNGQPNSLGSNVVSQLGAIAGLKAKDEWFPEVLRISRHNQGLIHAAVQQIDELTMPIFPSHGNFVAIDCSRAGISPEALCDGFLRRDIQIRHAGYHTDRYADRFIKVSTTVPTQHTQQFCDVLPAVVTEALASQPATEKHY
jgi:aspartate/methionine/tyrosine aminotransferase